MKLVKYTEEHTPILAEWFKDTNMVEFLLAEPPNESLPYLRYMICLDDNSPVGYIILYNIDTERKNADAGIVIPDKRGRGLSHSAGRTMLLWAFSDNGLGLERVRLKVLRTNRIARRLAELFGFEHEGTERQAAIHNGEREDIYIYGLLKNEFKGGMQGG